MAKSWDHVVIIFGGERVLGACIPIEICDCLIGDEGGRAGQERVVG